MNFAEAPPVVVALGSNLGDSRQILRRALDRLQSLSVHPIVRSSLWESAPIDCPPGSPPFVNAAVCLTPFPNETSAGLLAKLQDMEREFGRKPKVLFNEPRPLDLDLICYGDAASSALELTLPHPRAHLRAFVLAPLAEIAPDLILPGRTETVRQLLEALGSGQAVRRITE